MSEFDVRQHLSYLFAPGGQLHERYAPPVEGEVEDLVPGNVWQTFVYPHGAANPLIMRIYRLGAAETVLTSFWRNETRALMRISRRQHPALPILRDAASLPSLGLGYLFIEDPGQPLVGAHIALQRLRKDRVHALRMLLNLLDAVALLHREGLIHRTITPQVLCALDEHDSSPRLDGFQMSAFVASWLRGQGVVHESRGSALLPRDAASLITLAPERLGPLLGRSVRDLENFSCDVFSLGMVGIDWFVGLPPQEECRAAVLNGYDESAHRRLIESAQQRLRQAQLPLELRRLLEQMTAPAARNRIPSAIEAHATLGRLFPSLLNQFEAEASQARRAPLHLYFLRQSVERMYKDGAGRSAPERLDEQEYAGLIERDLTGGVLTWSPQGFEPWDSGVAQDAGSAKVVLLGQRYAYFCQYLYQDSPKEDRRVLVVKYADHASRVRELRNQPRQRTMPTVSASFFRQTGRTRPPATDDSWADLVESIRFDSASIHVPEVSATVDWLVQVHEAELAIKEYAYERVEDGPAPPGDLTPRPIILRATARQPPTHLKDPKDAFAELFWRAGKVPEMGDFFERMVEEAVDRDEQPVFLLRDEQGRDVPLKLQFDARLDARSVRFKPMEGDRLIPRRGRLRLDDSRSRAVLHRQQRAALGLSQDHELLAQLREPRALELATPAELQHVARHIQDERTAQLIRRIIASWPLFVLQGPPGTGKTFVASNVILDVLKTDPFARILVSAQSNDALDNLLEVISEQLRKSWPDKELRPLSVRVASQATEHRVSLRARDSLVAHVVEDMRGRLERSEASDNTPALAAIQDQWQTTARKQELDVELFHRVQRAASIVFATCAGAGANTEAMRAGGFDLVVIEEAARAWLSELAIPLVQGDRWLLIGDQAQLPAFRYGEVEQMLRHDIRERLTAESVGRPATEAMLPYLKHFRHLMEGASAHGSSSPPRHMIDEQRRMHPDISELVSHGFYGGQLRPHPDTRRLHGVKRPEQFRQSALLWVDTSSLGIGAYERGRTNQAEMQLLKHLLNTMGELRQHDPDIPAVVVLTPYLKQRELLRKRIQLAPESFHSVDSFQGRQAEVVFVSLVRNNANERQAQALGFLDDPARINVMFSRARRLLVILGSLRHFERFSDLPHWANVTRHIRSQERFRLNAADPALGFHFKASSGGKP
ncbi:AAA domain-containing protein [Stigmatella aurantiaca]|uniref:Protein kinase n=2 Tax=Stigmatella aurantiaca (strain DW4/3-1) TaxID=378806 RepID=E3FF42_STIAD|nr:AAA domain-containing protein [Stigmatella aurantiaca]ADO70223.1 Protein kinase [Stigmatella aurantiaca DW4/3-1]